MENVMEFLPFMLEGSVMTVELFAITLVLSLPLGLPFALGSNSRIWPIKIFAESMYGFSEEHLFCCSCFSFTSFSRWCWDGR